MIGTTVMKGLNTGYLRSDKSSQSIAGQRCCHCTDQLHDYSMSNTVELTKDNCRGVFGTVSNI